MAKPGASPIERPPKELEVQSGSPEVSTTTGENPTSEDPLVVAFNRIRDELVSTLMYILGNADDAQDVAQETFLKCWRARSSTAEVQNLRAWIFRVGLNAAKDLQRSAWNRKSRPLPEEEMMVPHRAIGAAEMIEDRETLDQLRAAIAELCQDEKEVFLLRQNGELTYEEIAAMRSIPVGTVKTQMRSALIKLRKVLNPESASQE